MTLFLLKDIQKEGLGPMHEGWSLEKEMSEQKRRYA